MKVSELLDRLGACKDGKRFFKRMFPRGLTLGEPLSDQDALRLAKRCMDPRSDAASHVRWLVDELRGRLVPPAFDVIFWEHYFGCGHQREPWFLGHGKLTAWVDYIKAVWAAVALYAGRG